MAPVLVALTKYNNQINDQFIVDIRKCELLIADLEHKPASY